MDDERNTQIHEWKKVIKDSPQKYKALNKNFTRLHRKAKKKWMDEKCKEIETVQEKHDTSNKYRNIREVIWKFWVNYGSILKIKMVVFSFIQQSTIESKLLYLFESLSLFLAIFISVLKITQVLSSPPEFFYYYHP